MAYKVNNNFDMTYFPWTTDQSYRAKQLSIISPDTIQSLFLYNLNKNSELELKLIPNSVSEQYSSRILKESSIYGRLRPINFYTGGGGKTLSFSVELHEDINHIDNSIYNLLNNIKEMSKPTYNRARGTIEEPLVYIQLGDQFAGIGHIESEYTLNKPFRYDETRDNFGRYAYATLSITFTFHEEFENVQRTLSQEGVTTYSSSIALDLNNAYNNYISIQSQDPRYGRVPNLTSIISIDDFIEKIEANQYLITQSFVDEKMLGGFMNAVGISPNALFGDSLGNNITISEAVESGQRIFSSSYGYPEYIEIVFNYYIDLSNILSSDLVVVDKQAAVTNLRPLIYSTYLEWNKLSSSINRRDNDIEAAVQQLKTLLSIVEDQINVYASLKGAGR